jgi:hypothetical protein
MSASILARYYASKAVKTQLQSHKIKLAEVDGADLRRAVEVWLDQHRDELLAQAEQTIASWPPLRKLETKRSAELCAKWLKCAEWQIETGDKPNGCTSEADRTKH